MRRKAQRARDAIQNIFDHDHSLRPAEAAERGLRSLVRLADPARRIERRESDTRYRNGTARATAPGRKDPDSSRHPSTAQICTPRSRPSLVKAGLKRAKNGCRLPVSAISSTARQPHPHRAASSSTCPAPRSPPTDSPALLCRRTLRPCAGIAPSPDCAECPARAPPHPASRSGCCVEESTSNAAGFIQARDGALRFQIEMLLAADRQFACNAVRAAGNLSRRIAAPDAKRARNENSPPRSRPRSSGSRAGARTPRARAPLPAAPLPASPPAPRPPAANGK